MQNIENTQRQIRLKRRSKQEQIDDNDQHKLEISIVLAIEGASFC